MSDPKATAPPEAYYASGSYQQGGTPAAVSTANDQEYAQRLQNEEFRNAQQQQQHHQVRDLAWLGLAWRGVACLAREVVCVLTLGVCVDAVCILYAQHVPRGTVRGLGLGTPRRNLQHDSNTGFSRTGFLLKK